MHPSPRAPNRFTESDLFEHALIAFSSQDGFAGRAYE